MAEIGIDIGAQHSKPLDEYGPNVKYFLETVREADALLVSTAAYHGTLAGVTKNALDFAQFLARDPAPYLDGKVVGIVVTSGGEQAATNAAGALADTVHALRGIVAPLMVTIPRAWQLFENGEITDEAYGARLEKLGELVVDLANRMNGTGAKSSDRVAGAA